MRKLLKECTGVASLSLGPVTCVNLTRDGQCVLTSSLDSTLRLLDKESGELLNELVKMILSYLCGDLVSI